MLPAAKQGPSPHVCLLVLAGMLDHWRESGKPDQQRIRSADRRDGVSESGCLADPGPTGRKSQSLRHASVPLSPPQLCPGIAEPKHWAVTSQARITPTARMKAPGLPVTRAVAFARR